MAGERPSPTPPTAQDANNPPTAASSNLPYGYVRAAEAARSRGDRQPPARYYGLEGTPHPNPLARDLPLPARPTPKQSAPTVGNPFPLANQGNQTPQPPQQPPQRLQQPQGRVVMESRIPPYYLATGDYAKHAALMASSASIMFPVEEVEEEEAVAAPAPQQMFKPDVEAAKILVNMSTEDCASYNERNGL